MSKELKSIREFALIAFVLLGVLFGMVIMNFIFGVLGPSAFPSPDNVLTVNRTDTYINTSNFTIPEAATELFNGGFNVILAVNATSVTDIVASNYTFYPATGLITNSTSYRFDNVTLTYSYNSKSISTINAEHIQNNSLQAIVTYTEGADTQMSTVSIAIILGLLIAVFLLFWGIFVKNKKGIGSESGGTFG